MFLIKFSNVTFKNNAFGRLRRELVGKVLASQAKGPEFEAQVLASLAYLLVSGKPMRALVSSTVFQKESGTWGDVSVDKALVSQP